MMEHFVCIEVMNLDTITCLAGNSATQRCVQRPALCASSAPVIITDPIHNDILFKVDHPGRGGAWRITPPISKNILHKINILFSKTGKPRATRRDGRTGRTFISRFNDFLLSKGGLGKSGGDAHRHFAFGIKNTSGRNAAGAFSFSLQTRQPATDSAGRVFSGVIPATAATRCHPAGPRVSVGAGFTRKENNKTTYIMDNIKPNYSDFVMRAERMFGMPGEAFLSDYRAYLYSEERRLERELANAPAQYTDPEELRDMQEAIRDELHQVRDEGGRYDRIMSMEDDSKEEERFRRQLCYSQGLSY